MVGTITGTEMMNLKTGRGREWDEGNTVAVDMPIPSLSLILLLTHLHIHPPTCLSTAPTELPKYTPTAVHTPIRLHTRIFVHTPTYPSIHLPIHLYT